MTKGVIFELSIFRRKANIPWIQFDVRVKAISDSDFSVTFKKKGSELSRNKKTAEIERLFSEPFCSQCKTSHVELIPTELSLAKEKSKTEELTKKLSKLSVQNVNKRMKCREEKIAESKTQIQEMGKEMKHQDKVINTLESQLHNAHSSIHSRKR